MNKKLMMGITTALMVGTIAGCAATASAAFNFNYNSSNTSSTTTTETDADGNITETTVVEKTVNGETTEATIVEYTEAATGLKYLVKVPVILANYSDVDMKEFNIALSEDTVWGDNCIPEDMVIANGDEVEDLMTLTVIESGCEFDIRVIDTEGAEYLFENVDLSNISKDQVILSFEGNAEEGYTFYHTTDAE